MRIGIDFGTSYTAAAAFDKNKLVPIRFGDDFQFRTSVFFPEAVPDLGNFVLTAQQEGEVASILRAAKAQQRRAQIEAEKRRQEAVKIKDQSRRDEALAMIASPTIRNDDELRRSATSAVRRRWIEEQFLKAKESVVQVENALFGEEAINAYFAEGAGSLVESPKSMLGYSLAPHAFETIVSIISHILQHVRLQATRQLKTSIRSAVLGRPVNFRSSMGERGNAQAISILHTAALRAGFEDVTFFEEPAAAAMYYHSSSKAAHRALIIDVGGGTTDFALADIGGSLSSPQIQSFWGLPIGGSDLDIELSLKKFMPLFGRDEDILPARHFVEAASVHDAPRQQKFREHGYYGLAEPFGDRLRTLQQRGMTTRLNRAVERTKIFLSENARSRVRLGFIQAGLLASASQHDLQQAAEPYLNKLRRTLVDISQKIVDPLDAIFLTGGMSRAPLIQECVAACFPKTKLVKGDPSFGVVSGLGVHASLI